MTNDNPRPVYRRIVRIECGPAPHDGRVILDDGSTLGLVRAITTKQSVDTVPRVTLEIVGLEIEAVIERAM